MPRKKSKLWSEDELILTFGLKRHTTNFALLKTWLTTEPVQLSAYEERFLDKLLFLAQRGADFWNEETLKMRFISPLLSVLVQFDDEQGRYDGFFDKEISAEVEGIFLQTETDFMLAKGVGNIARTPYFHFQEYKRSKKSPPEPMAQLIEAFLIAQETNQNGKPMYGAISAGRSWQFVVMQAKNYGVSRLFDATEKEDLLRIVAVLRKFKDILETELIES